MRTVHLGQYTDEHADEIVERLERAGIVHWEKRSGTFTRFFVMDAWGVRVFVDVDRLDEARRIADEVLAED